MPEDAPHNNAGSSDYDLRLFSQLLKPSTLSALVCALISFFVVGGVMAVTSYQGSSFQQDFLGFQQRASDDAKQAGASLTEDYGHINENFADSDIVRNIPVMAFWMFVGTLMYFLVTGIIGALASANELEHELHYVHARRKELLRDVYIKTAIRFFALLFWLLYIMLFFRIIVPYVLAAAHVAGGDIISLQAVPYTVLAFMIILFSLHIHLILARLATLRPRLFSQETSF